MDAVEEHLLVCAACQTRLDEVETFTLAMRQAITDEPVAEVRAGWFTWLRPPRPALIWASGFALVVLAAGLYLRTGRSGSVMPVAALELTAMRGDVQSVGVAQETDIKLGDVPVEAGLRVEVVDATGGTVWSSARGADAGRLKIAKELEQGSYFVRLYDGGGKLLHEYGFRVSSGIR